MYFSEFVDVDKIIITIEMQDISDTAAEINDNKDEDDERNAAKVPPIYSIAFDALEILWDFFNLIREVKQQFRT